MRRLLLALMSVLAVAMAAPLALAQTASSWTPPKTPWGDPDLQGIWPSTHMLQTPVQRDPKMGTRAVLNDEEYAQRMRQVKAFANIEAGNPDRVPISAGWFDPGKGSRQASLVVDPPDGRIPALTPETQKREAERLARYKEKKEAPDTWQDLTTWDRCISLGAVGSMLPFYYNNGIEIVQAPGYVVIRNEMIHEARVVPLDGRPHLSANVTSYMGDSRGHWDGSTLVVVTKNLNGMTGVGGNGGGRTSGRLTITERFTMLDANTLQYTATIDDPGTWTRPWTLSFPWKREPVYGMFEYGCHEGNYAMRNMLSASRAAEASASK